MKEINKEANPFIQAELLYQEAKKSVKSTCELNAIREHLWEMLETQQKINKALKELQNTWEKRK